MIRINEIGKEGRVQTNRNDIPVVVIKGDNGKVLSSEEVTVEDGLVKFVLPEFLAGDECKFSVDLIFKDPAMTLIDIMEFKVERNEVDDSAISPPKDAQQIMDTAVDEAKERIKLKDQIAELKYVVQLCFNDACSPSGKISKNTAIELMKHAGTRA